MCERHPRASQLIHELGLQPHPEGGFFREIFRSTDQVQPIDGRPPRSALTTIYFLLPRGQHSRWHRVASDEVWHFYEGEPLELVWVDREAVVHCVTLASGVADAQPVAVVPADCWQAARPVGAYALVGCTVGPGFDFADFAMLDAASPEGESLCALPGLPEGLG